MMLEDGVAPEAAVRCALATAARLDVNSGAPFDVHAVDDEIYGRN